MSRQFKLLEVPRELLDVTPEPVETAPPARFAPLARLATGKSRTSSEMDCSGSPRQRDRQGSGD